MNNFAINKVVKQMLADKGLREACDYVLVSSPGKVKDSERRRYLWNLHCHGHKRIIDPEKTFLLVALAERPTDISGVAIKHAFRLPSERSAQASTVAYTDGAKTLEAFRVL